MFQSLLGHPPLLTGESLASFLIRVSDANFYQGQNTLADLVLSVDAEDPEDNLRYPRSADTFDYLSALTQVSERDLYSATAHTFADVLTPPEYPIEILRLSDNTPVHLLSYKIAQKSLRAVSAAQFCPGCLDQSAYHRLIWTPTATSVCLEHYCLLLDRCQICSRQVTVRDIVMAKCGGCGANLRLAESVQVDEFGLLEQRVIQAWLSGYSPALPENFIPQQLPRVLYRVIEGLRFTAQQLAASGWPLLHTLASRPNGPVMTYIVGSNALSPFQSYCLYTTAFRGIVNWPTEFYKLLDAQRSQAGVKIRGSKMQEDLGSLYSLWYEFHWKIHPAFSFVQNAFDEYLAEHYGSVPSSSHWDRVCRRPDLAEKFGYISIYRAEEAVGIPTLTIQRLIHTGKLKVHILYDDKYHIKDELVYKADLMRLHGCLTPSLSLTEVIQILGVSEDVISELVRMGILAVEYGRCRRFHCWKFRAVELQVFLSKIKNSPRVGMLDGLDHKYVAMSLDTASHTLAVDGFNAASTLQLVAEGKLRAYYNPYKTFRCGDLLFDPGDLQACLGEIKSENTWISRAEVTKRLKVHDSTLAKWVNAQLLSPVASYAGAQYFDMAEVERFSTTIIDGWEAARLLHAGLFSVDMCVRRGGLKALAGPVIDGCFDYRFNKADLLRWFYGKVTFGVAAQILDVSHSTLHQWIEEERILPLDNIGGKQCWFSRRAVMTLLERIEMDTNCTEVWRYTGNGYRLEKIPPLQ